MSPTSCFCLLILSRGGRAQDRLWHLEPLSRRLAVTKAPDPNHGRVVHQAFVAFCEFEPCPIVAKNRRLHWFSYEATAPRYFNHTANTDSNLRDAGKIGIAIERCVLKIFLPFDELDNLVCQRGIESPLRMPGRQLEVRIITGSWEILENVLYRRLIHLDSGSHPDQD